MLGRNPARNSNFSLSGEDELSSGPLFSSGNRGIITKLETENQEENRFLGNKCGHSPKNFKNYERPQNFRTKFHVIEEGIRKSSYIASGNNIVKFPAVYNLLRHFKDSEKSRLWRSERRESFHLVLPALIELYNLSTGFCGYLDYQFNFHFYGIDKLKALTGLSRSRLYRCLKKLRKIGLIEIDTILKQVKEISPTGMVYYRVITETVKIKVSDKIFYMLGITEEEFLKDRARSIKFDERRLEAYKRKISYLRSIPSISTDQNRQERPQTNKTVSGQDLSSILSRMANKGKTYIQPAFNPFHDKEVCREYLEMTKSGLSTQEAALKLFRNRGSPDEWRVHPAFKSIE